MDTSSYKVALTILDRMYIKKKNEMVSRHLLATRRQLSSNSIDGFYQALIKLNKDCSLSSVSAKQYRAELIQDAFIYTLWSMDIQQRILEKTAPKHYSKPMTKLEYIKL